MSTRTSSLLLRGERVQIRWWENRDDRVQRSWPRYQEPMHVLWNIPRSVSRGRSTASLMRWSSMRRVWAIDNWRGELIGRISLRDIEPELKRARLGISLSASQLGKGLGTEAMAVFLDYYFTDYGFDLIMLDVAAFNERAVRCYERLGFRCTSDEWRKTHADATARLLEQPAYQHLKPFFRRERHGLLVLFYEMELHADEWQQSDLAYHSTPY